MMHLGFNEARDQRYAHRDSRFDHVLHICDANWHGIRNCVGALPGHKLTIDSKSPVTATGLKHIVGLIFQHDIRRICFQGYSPVADAIARELNNRFKGDLAQFYVGHVNSAQLEYYFEMDMQALLVAAFKEGIFSRIGSVKPGFHHVFSGCFEPTIINLPPIDPFQEAKPPKKEANSLFMPLETGWRKNLWTNMIAALQAPGVEKIYTVNWPKGLDALFEMDRVQVTGFLDRQGMFQRMARSEIVLNMTLAECQPMIQLEAMAVGTPALMGALDIPELKDEWAQMTEVSPADTPEHLINALIKLKEAMKTDERAVYAMMADHLERRSVLGLNRLSEFLYV